MRRPATNAFVFTVVLILLGVVVGAELQSQAQLSRSQAVVPPTTSQPANQAGSTVSAESQLYRTIYDEANPLVVSIRVRIPTQDLPVNSDNGLPGSNQPYQLAAGSGFVYDNQGHIVT